MHSMSLSVLYVFDYLNHQCIYYIIIRIKHHEYKYIFLYLNDKNLLNVVAIKSLADNS